MHFSQTKTTKNNKNIFLRTKVFLSPPPFADISAKNLSFFGRLPLENTNFIINTLKWLVTQKFYFLLGFPHKYKTFLFYNMYL